MSIFYHYRIDRLKVSLTRKVRQALAPTVSGLDRTLPAGHDGFDGAISRPDRFAQLSSRRGRLPISSCGRALPYSMQRRGGTASAALGLLPLLRSSFPPSEMFDEPLHTDSGSRRRRLTRLLNADFHSGSRFASVADGR